MTLHVWLRLYTTGTQDSCIRHHGQGRHQHLGNHRVRCGRPTAAAPGKKNSFGDEQDETTAVSKQGSSDYDRSKQLLLRESESSLLVQRLENLSRGSPGGSTFRSFLRGAGGEG